MDVRGPWKLSDIRSLERICLDAQWLSEPALGGLMARPPNPDGFRDIGEARKSLEVHPIYRWLKRELPKVLKLAPTSSSPVTHFRFIYALVHDIAIAFEEAARPRLAKVRTDKKRVAAWEAVERVEGLLHNGTIKLTDPKDGMLSLLLAEARSELMTSPGKGARYSSLQELARDLHSFSIADASIIMTVAALTGLRCSERTAQRYIAKASAS